MSGRQRQHLSQMYWVGSFDTRITGKLLWQMPSRYSHGNAAFRAAWGSYVMEYASVIFNVRAGCVLLHSHHLTLQHTAIYLPATLF